MRHTSALRISAVVLGGVAGLASSADAQYSIQKIVATGETASGGPTPVTDCAAPLIDQYGQTAVLLNVLGGDTRHVARGLSHLSTMLKVGDDAPDFDFGSGGVVTGIGALVNLSSDGELAVSFEMLDFQNHIARFRTVIGDPFDWKTGYSSGEYIPERYGNPRPWFSGLPQTSLLAPGKRWGIWHEGQFGHGVYTMPGNVLEHVIASGDTPGFGSDEVDEVRAMAINADGRVLFDFLVTRDGHPHERSLAVGGMDWDIADIVRSWDVAPDGGTFELSAPIRASLNAGYGVVFAWRTDVVNENHDAGIWLFAPDQGLKRVMLEGFGVPGHSGLAFGEPHDYAGDANMMRSPVVGAGGHVAFVTRLRGNGVTASNDTALFAGLPGQLELIAREGQPSAQGEPAFGDFLDADVSFFLNARGDLVFMANRVDNGEGVWHRTADGSHYARLTATGRTLPVNGQSRTVNRISDPARCSGGQDGRGSPFNDNGQISFSLQFTDGTHAIYRVDAPTPCPADFNQDGTVNTLDFIAFLNAWNARQGPADFNGDGAVNTLDVIAFLNAFTAGC
jgi:hypothetical protein